jgi:type I restriction enzyme, S subunit
MTASMFAPPRVNERPDWAKRTLRTILMPRSERERPDLPLLTVARERGVFVRSTDDVNHNVIPEDLSNYKVARQGDLVINKMKAWQGSIGLAPVDGIVSPAYFVFKANFAVPKFGEYLLRSQPYVAKFAAASDGVRVGQWDLNISRMRNIEVLLPSTEEQAAIVKYLGHANARIDKAIAAKRRLIARLIESRSATVDALVLGSGRTDRTASTSPWLESIPAGWQWRRCRTLASLVTSGSRGWAEYYSDAGPLFLQSGNLGRQLNLKLAKVQRVTLPSSATEGLRTRVKGRDILVCITGALTGNVALVPEKWDEEAYINQHIALVRPRNEAVNSEFLGYAIKSLPSQVQFRGSEYGGTKQGLGLDEVKNLDVLLPPLDEQQVIVEEIRNKTKRIDTAVVRAEHEVALLGEFRTRLVADVVTGQFDVRAAAGSLPEATTIVSTGTQASRISESRT